MALSRRSLTLLGVALGAIVLAVVVVLALSGGDKPSAANAEAPSAPAANATTTPSPTTVAPLIRNPSKNETNATTPRNTTATVYKTNSDGKGGSCSAGVTPLVSGVFNLTVNGSERTYTVRVPTNYNASKPYRLLLAFHWHGGTMADVANKFLYYGMLLHQNETTILIAPQGLENAWKNNGGEDIEFVRQILAAVERRVCVDPRQRYAMGFSYGASMTHSVACSLGTQFRAVSVLSGGEYSGCEGSGSGDSADGTTTTVPPVAYMIMHGIRDTVIPIEKGRALRDTFVKANKCVVPSTPPPEPKEGDLNHIRTAYAGCSSGHPVEWTVFDDGHTAMPLDGTLMLNSTATWMPKAVWTFFSQFM